MSAPARSVRTLLTLAALVAATPLFAQQTGTVLGRVTSTDGARLPGVAIVATSPVLPQPRETVSDAVGEYRLPALPPGQYTVTYRLAGMQEATRRAQVLLGQDTLADVTLGVGLTETLEVAAEVSLIDKDSATIKATIANDEIMALPVGQEYRDLQKLIPGVQFSQDQTRGPSAGGSGQDNVYQFDGVNVNLPLFGTLSAEPASHDIAEVTVVKGGARAVDFDRSGGFSIDTVSRSGTGQFHGWLGYQFQSDAMSADLDSGSLSRYDQDLGWITANLGGPIVRDRLYFYTSYYRPTRNRENRANLYGELPDYESVRNEGFGKLTFTPTKDLLLNASYRESKRVDESDLFASNASATTGTGNEARLRIFTGDGSWILSPSSFLTFKYTHFENLTAGVPDNVASVAPNLTPGTTIDLNGLDAQGRLTVPVPVSGQPVYNAFVQPLIDRYGYTQDGVKVGGGTVGYGSEFNDQDFFRDAFQVAYNLTLGSTVRHDLHVGYQWYEDEEELVRSSNGWGLISVPGGRLSPPIAGNAQRAFYTARIQQQTTGQAAPIRSSYRSQSIELNDAIKWGSWTLNVGVLFSNDKLYGQGLREDGSTLSGYVAAPGNRYEMYEIGWGEMIQPRLSATWAYNGKDTVYGGWARYNPAASSLPRAASWDRNLVGTFVDAHFDQGGVLFGSVPVGSSSGKLFDDDLTPRTTDELLLGTAKQLGSRWSTRLYGRYRESRHFWEDTNNNARIAFDPPPDVPRELYIPDLAARLAQIGSGSSYVIAELDGAYTKFWEATLETEYRSDKTYLRASYTWSKYYGNFDQDNSTGANDQNIFIGSSNIADGAGRQLWDFKDGTLRGDRPHLVKAYGIQQLPWRASVGAYFVAQSGQPWERWSFEPYIDLTTSTSDVNRYAEKAGSRRTDAHWQLDVNYTQNFRLGGRLNLQVLADVYNVFDNQTGYDINPNLSSSTFGLPRAYFTPLRLQLAARLQF